MIETVPKYGTAFKGPSEAEIENHKLEQPAKYFDRNQVRALLRVTKGTDKQQQRMHAAILLAVNTGCQNIDIERLRFKDIDWNGQWFNQPRKKKGKARRAKLWSRTVKALNRYIGDRERNPDDLVFVSNNGGIWHGRNCIAKEFAVYKIEAKITTARSGYQWLRHSFVTTAEQLGDRIAVQIAVGHADRSITANYVHSVYDPRQTAIAKHVESWLVGRRRKK